MKNLKISILSLSMGLFIAACNNCGTKSMSSSDSTSAATTVTTPAAVTPAAPTDTTSTPATTTADAGGTNNNSGNNGSGTVKSTTTTKTERTTHRSAADKGDGRDHSDNSLSSGTDNVERTKDANGKTIVRPVNNPPKGTFGNSVNQDTH